MLNRKMFQKGQRHKLLIHLFFIVACLTFVLPMIMVVSISLSSEDAVTAANAGYSLFPRGFTLDAYKMAFGNSGSIQRAYGVTAAQAILGTLLSCIVAGMVAYPLSRSNFAYRKPITFYIFFTMLFSGGMIPTYIIYTRWYGLGDSFWVYILPNITGGAWNTLVIRTFFKNLPESLFESAKIDGAKELRIFFQIALPLSTPVFATVGFMTLVAKWNDWNTSLIYIYNPELYTLQYLLQKVLNEAQFLRSMTANNMVGIDFSKFKQPTETLRYALCVIAAGPMLLVFPFFQKYFSQGLTVGAVKG
ncbi:carbohydrate ABC transporter permease [Beduinella massiliensis]|uniref:carbohydrate ABC transporter permease n=1 Tax=Beduinella massiliensis TaxID=1852363 RepID=UPI0031F9F3AA